MGESMENALRYHIEVDLSQKDSPHTQLIRLTGRNKEVLEVGPATGYVTKVLKERGCRVTCIENDPEAAEVASEFCERIIVANVESIEFPSTFPEQRFDVITFGDVLEHLIDPLGVLISVRDILKRGGYIVASVPNIGHSSIRLALLKGQFEYTEKGLLDRTHLRFFTAESLAQLFHQAGYETRAWRRVVLDPFATEADLKEEEFPSWLTEAARGDGHGITYQFVVRAYPVGSARNGRTGSLTLRAPGTNLVDGLWRWNRHVEDEFRIRDMALANKEQVLREAYAKVEERDTLLAARERSLKEAQAQLHEITQSVGYRLLQAYRRRIRDLLPESSKRDAPYRFLQAIARRGSEARSHARSRRSQPAKDKDGGRGNQR